MTTLQQHVFPAIKGVQAGHAYYVIMCKLKLIPTLFLFNEHDIQPDLRAQRALNTTRIPEIVNYILNNPKGYVFSAITASVDAEVCFEALGETKETRLVGLLKIPVSARFVINDGQHRRAAIEHSLNIRPELGNESISVVLYLDHGLKKCQQMFADLNRYAVRPSTSVGVLYDHRDPIAYITRSVVASIPLFYELVDKEKTSLAPRSKKLFTLSAVYHATRQFLSQTKSIDHETSLSLARQFWESLTITFSEWQAVFKGELLASDIRAKYIHTHGVVVQAIAKLGASLLQSTPDGWSARLADLGNIDWKRSNSFWEGRTFNGGRIQKGQANLVLTCNAIKILLDIELDHYEQELEDNHSRNYHGKN